MTEQSRSATMCRQQLNKAFINAINGMKYFFRFERNGIIQAGVTIFVLMMGLYLHISLSEWIIICLCICAVISMEMMNTALENLCNLVHAEYHPTIKIIKDVAAGAVFFAAIISAVIGLIIFVPKLLLLF